MPTSKQSRRQFLKSAAGLGITGAAAGFCVMKFAETTVLAFDAAGLDGKPMTPAEKEEWSAKSDSVSLELAAICGLGGIGMILIESQESETAAPDLQRS